MTQRRLRSRCNGYFWWLPSLTTRSSTTFDSPDPWQSSCPSEGCSIGVTQLLSSAAASDGVGPNLRRNTAVSWQSSCTAEDRSIADAQPPCGSVGWCKTLPPTLTKHSIHYFPAAEMEMLAHCTSDFLAVKSRCGGSTIRVAQPLRCNVGWCCVQHGMAERMRARADRQLGLAEIQSMQDAHHYSGRGHSSRRRLARKSVTPCASTSHRRLATLELQPISASVSVLSTEVGVLRSRLNATQITRGDFIERAASAVQNAARALGCEERDL